MSPMSPPPIREVPDLGPVPFDGPPSVDPDLAAPIQNAYYQSHSHGERPQRAHHQQTPEEKRAHAEARALAEVAAQIVPRRFVVEGFASAEQQYGVKSPPVEMRRPAEYNPQPAYTASNMGGFDEQRTSPDRYQLHSLSSLPVSGLAGRQSRFDN
jgi:hypothetical protein